MIRSRMALWHLHFIALIALIALIAYPYFSILLILIFKLLVSWVEKMIKNMFLTSPIFIESTIIIC